MHLTYFAVSWALIGLIWVIQLVKYPAFHFVDASRFLEYHRHHTRSITLVVMPLMLSELLLAVLICVKNGWEWPALISLAIVVAIWCSTFFIQIPLHRLLENGKDEKAINRLVSTNWVRTWLWTGKGILLFFQ